MRVLLVFYSHQFLKIDFVRYYIYDYVKRFLAFTSAPINIMGCDMYMFLRIENKNNNRGKASDGDKSLL